MYIRGVRGYLILLGTFILSIILASFVFAAGSSVPSGPDTLNVAESGRRGNVSDPLSIQAEAGNVTALTISTEEVTKAWQAYYGNVTGTITLDDANNVTFYDWSLPNPNGEIYASNGSSVTWANVYCMNLSHLRAKNGTQTEGLGGQIVYNINMSQIEVNFGINNTDLGASFNDLDGLNETFNDTYVDATGFRVGAITIDRDDGCSLAHPYANQAYESDWKELLLSDNTSLIFTALIRENGDMYKTAGTETADFEMLVLEDGHTSAATETTPYYFYVELS